MAESAQTIPDYSSVTGSTGSWRRSLALQPTTEEWMRHGALFLLTLVTTTLAGVMLASNVPEPDLPDPVSWTGYLTYLPHAYWLSLARLGELATDPHLLTQGLIFSGSLMSILLAHEMGHYLACRRYGVSATLPFFIPAPPLFLAGTFGAFIKIRSFIPTRRALFDIGLAGPLAGFVVALPVAVAGIAMLQPGSVPSDHTITFSDPLLFRILAR